MIIWTLSTLFKLIEKKPIPSFSAIESDLKKMIQKDSRNELSKQAFYRKLHKKYKVANRPSEYSSFRKKAFSDVNKGLFTISSVNNTILLTIDDMPISVNDFAKYILESQSKGNRDIDQMYIDFVNARLLNYEESKLEDNYPEYKALLQEYKEGILLNPICY